MTAGDWGSYLYPGTSTLRNRFNERDPEVLHAKEYHRATLREFQLRTGHARVPLTFDDAHIRAIHRHLFQDVYGWAGELRTVNMRKPDSPVGFASVDAGEISRYLGDATRIVRATEWPELDRQGFATAIADVYAHVNQAHPFREGNGRSAKLFLEHVAEQSPFTLNYDLVTRDEWNTAAVFSRPDRGSYAVHPESVRPVFQKIAVERVPPTARAAATPGVPLERTPGRSRTRDHGPSAPNPRGLER